MWKVTIACIVAARCAGIPPWTGHGSYETRAECLAAGAGILEIARALTKNPPRVSDFFVTCKQEKR